MNEKPRQMTTGSRDAAETSIDSVKGNAKETWESIVARNPRRIASWKSEDRAEEVQARACKD